MSTPAIATSSTGINRQRATPATSAGREPILVVEADADYGRALVEQLAADGHPAQHSRTASHAEMTAGAHPPRLLVLGDLRSPRGTLDLLEAIRRHDPKASGRQTASPWPRNLPVIVLSSRRTEPDMLRAFEAGTDDFVARPARYLELRARIRALLRRADDANQQVVPVQIGPLTIEPAAYAATFHGERLKLRRMEYELLLHLASNPNRVFRRQELLSAVWGFRSDGTTRTVDSHASRLRRKLSAAGEHWIISVRGVGYRLV